MGCKATDERARAVCTAPRGATPCCGRRGHCDVNIAINVQHSEQLFRCRSQLKTYPVPDKIVGDHASRGQQVQQARRQSAAAPAAAPTAALASRQLIT